VWDKVFETKTVLALKEVLEAEDPKAIELPRVIKNAAGKDVIANGRLFQLLDGCIVSKYRMSKVSYQLSQLTGLNTCRQSIETHLKESHCYGRTSGLYGLLLARRRLYFLCT
jgi:hypothetical protein